MLSFTLERPRLIRRTARSCVLTTHRRNAAHGGLVTSAGAPFPLTHRPPAAPHRTGKSYARPVLPLHSDLKKSRLFLSFIHGVQWPDLSPSKGEEGESQEASKQLIHHPANPAPAATLPPAISFPHSAFAGGHSQQAFHILSSGLVRRRGSEQGRARLSMPRP